MIKSMTGFAAAEKIDGGITVSADMRAYNSRHLDIVLRIPPSYLVLEDKMKGLVAERIARGRVEIKIQIKDESEQAMAFEIDQLRANGIHSALGQLKKEFNLVNDISIEHLLNIGGIIKPVEPADKPDRRQREDYGHRTHHQPPARSTPFQPVDRARRFFGR